MWPVTTWSLPGSNEVYVLLNKYIFWLFCYIRYLTFARYCVVLFYYLLHMHKHKRGIQTLLIFIMTINDFNIAFHSYYVSCLKFADYKTAFTNTYTTCNCTLPMLPTSMVYQINLKLIPNLFYAQCLVFRILDNTEYQSNEYSPFAHH